MSKRNTSMFASKLISYTLVCSVTVGLFTSNVRPIQVHAADVPPMFKTQVGGIFDGMPLFDGVPDHMEEFVDTYFNYTGLEGPAVYVAGARNIFTLTRGSNVGKKIPGALSASDNDQGVSTDFPAYVGMGQSWNKNLIAEIGNVMGEEKLSKLRVKQGESNIQDGANASLSVAFTATSDLRVNPLIGRFDESFSEDDYLTSTLVDTMATGLSGIDQKVSTDGFWMRAAVGTKHYSVYNSQWFRGTTSNSAGARSIYEYYTRSPLKGFKSGSLAGAMTSYGRTNGIPNILSPFQIYANNNSKYGVYSSTDFFSDRYVYSDPFKPGAEGQGNGYDKQYAIDNTHASILFTLAKSGDGLQDVQSIVNAVENGLYDVTKEDLIEAARSHVNQMVRLGIFNEVDEKGIPKYYPFASGAKDVSVTESTYAVVEHQEVALRAAQESIVLLKNDGALPLAKDKKAAISGIYADSRFKTSKSLGTTPGLPNSGEAPLTSIIKQVGSANVSYNTGSKVIALTSKWNGGSVTSSTYDAGAKLVTSAGELNTSDPRQLFEVFDWGQNGVSLLSSQNKKWVTSPNTSNATVGNTDATKLNLTSNDWNGELLQGNTSTIPPTLRVEQNSDGTVSLVTDSFHLSFFGNFSNKYYTNGRLVLTGDDGSLKTSSTTLTDSATASEAKKDSRAKFNLTVTKEVGATAAARAETDDYAIVFVGSIPRHSAGEGNDRSSLYMGDDDYKLVKAVSDAFAAKGKKTVVIVRSSFPVIMKEIQDNPNVSAILYQPYGGQYDGEALAQVLYGDYAPTARLTSTWYADMSALPAISKYSIPEGNTTQTLSTTDPRYTIDMTAADPIESKLTYMYTEAPVTYPFGYGLSLSSFEYSDLTVPQSINDKDPFIVTVNLKNTGQVNTSEVVQLYMKNNDSAYGINAPFKKLVSYEKVALHAGETKNVTLKVDPNDMAVWDVNKGDLHVESGVYTVMVGASSQDIQLQQDVQVTGTPLQQLNIYKPFNVFDHSFTSNDIIYYEVAKERTAVNLKEKKVVAGYYAVGSKKNGSWTAIPKVNLTAAKQITARVASNTSGGVITLHADSPTNAPIAVLDVPITGPKSYTIVNANVAVTELGYTDITVDLSNTTLIGNHDLYVVFKAPDLRIDTLSFQTKPAVKAVGHITASQNNPKVDVEAVEAPFGIGATELKNWAFESGNSGLTLGSVTVNETGTMATLQLSGTASSGGTLSVTPKADAFNGNVIDGNVITFTIESTSSNSGTDTSQTSTPIVGNQGNGKPTTPQAIVEKLTDEERRKVELVKAQGVTLLGSPIKISIEHKNGLYVVAKVNVTPAIGQIITTLARVNDDGSLSPVPSMITTDANGNTVIQSMVSSEGLYVPVSVQRHFTDVPDNAWYAKDVAEASGLLLINGVTETTVDPSSATSAAQTLMVALNVLGVSPEKQSGDSTWFEAVVRTANKLGLIEYSSLPSDKPNSRGEMALVLTNVLKSAGIDVSLSDNEVNALLNGYSDAKDANAEHRKALAVMLKQGILIGISANEIAPNDVLTRAQLATVAIRTRNIIIKNVIQ
ncbi:carbohydrate-binding protein [Paenibacillus sp. LMG 31461]|uniref:Carbohydrate-binding protein n=1 Tax=Paenibacillus plantarum TaxID=2654975 RepID=A0ABX1X434_9BACL|nr:glycoside hydrolase family 3 C-terminal domain-containing protein [Paenibacillus plantarum]NOU62843.1 carbohydrate-binding protein [Paenibacillus plantarum]